VSEITPRSEKNESSAHDSFKREASHARNALLSDPKFRKFVAYLMENEQAKAVAVRIQKDGIDLHYVFRVLCLYCSGQSVAGERKQRERAFKNIVNKGARDYGVAPELAQHFLSRANAAHSVEGIARVHCVDAIGILQIEIEVRTERKPSSGELALLIDGARAALSLKPTIADPKNVERELRRWRKANPRFVKLVEKEVRARPEMR
jgi:hypothetical protein